MKKTFYYLTAVSSLIALSSYALAAVSLDKLVKVTSHTNVKCVEYYQYKGAMYCSTEVLSAQPLQADIVSYEKSTIHFDDRIWRAAWGEKTALGGTSVEYVPDGDDINNWTELVTSQFFPGLQKMATPKEFADKLIGDLKKSGFTPIITFIQDTPEKVIFEFRIESPENQMQDELQMITKGKDGLYVLHYVIKQKDMSQANRELWTKNLSQSAIIPH